MFNIDNQNLHILENETQQSEFQCFTVSQVAKLLKVKEACVYELINTYKVKAIKFSERRTRIPKSALEEFLKQELEKPLCYNNDVQPPRRGRKPKNVS